MERSGGSALHSRSRRSPLFSESAGADHAWSKDEPPSTWRFHDGNFASEFDCNSSNAACQPQTRMNCIPVTSPHNNRSIRSLRGPGSSPSTPLPQINRSTERFSITSPCKASRPSPRRVTVSHWRQPWAPILNTIFCGSHRGLFLARSQITFAPRLIPYVEVVLGRRYLRANINPRPLQNRDIASSSGGHRGSERIRKSAARLRHLAQLLSLDCASQHLCAAKLAASSATRASRFAPAYKAWAAANDFLFWSGAGFMPA